MIISYCISGPDNDSYLNSSLWGKNICECLEFIRNRENFINPQFKISKAKYDFSHTYDGATIVSTNFKTFCEENRIDGVQFHQLIQQKDLYLMKITKEIEFDSERRKTTFSEFNNECSEYNEVVGANPVCLIQKSEIKSGLYRTDIEFARGYAKHPLTLVGTETYSKMKKMGFKGLHGEKILDKYSWEEKH